MSQQSSPTPDRAAADREAFEKFAAMHPTANRRALLEEFIGDHEDAAGFWLEQGHKKDEQYHRELADWAWREIRGYN